jgi:hypothetical protein
MPNADITLDTNAISLLDGDVKIDGNTTIDKAANTRSLTVGGTGTGKIVVKNASGISILELASDLSKLTIRNSNNVARLELDAAAGTFRLRHSNGNIAAEISGSSGLTLRDSTNAVRAVIPTSSSSDALFYTDINMAGYDIKLDGKYLAARLTDIESRLDALDGGA